MKSKKNFDLFLCCRLSRAAKRSMTSAKESDLLQKVKSVVPKLTSGMHKVRFINKYSMTSVKESDLL